MCTISFILARFADPLIRGVGLGVELNEIVSHFRDNMYNCYVSGQGEDFHKLWYSVVLSQSNRRLRLMKSAYVLFSPLFDVFCILLIGQHGFMLKVIWPAVGQACS